MSRWWAVALAAGVLAGCAGKPVRNALQRFTEANESFRTGSLELAIEQYKEMLDQHPFSPHNEEAELRIAHAQYLAGNYAEAVASLTDFQRRHPTSPHLPFVGYMLGMCYVRQMRTPDRDQTAAQNAESYFLTVQQQFPDSPYAELAREQLAHCRESLATHELGIAEFYARRGDMRAAELRWLDLASRYGQTDAAADGLLKLARYYRKDGQTDNATLAYWALIQLHPQTEQASKARRALQRLSADTEQPPSDPIDLLYVANGRQRTRGTYETVRVPGLDTTPAGPMSGAGVPALMPPMDPFGRGGVGGGYYPY